MAQRKKYRVSCPVCGTWILNADALPEHTSIFHCAKCKNVKELKDLNIKQ